MNAWKLLRQARLDAGLTQGQLAVKAGTSQPAIARYEAAEVVPDWDTLARLLHGCGYRLEVSATRRDPDTDRQLRESIRSTPARRAERNRRVTSLAAQAANARRDGRVRPLREG